MRDSFAVMIGAILESLLVVLFLRKGLTDVPANEMEWGIYPGIVLCSIPIVLAVRFCFHIHRRYRTIYTCWCNLGSAGSMMSQIVGMYVCGLFAMWGTWKLMSWFSTLGGEKVDIAFLAVFLVFAVTVPGCIMTHALLHGEFTDEIAHNHNHGSPRRRTSSEKQTLTGEGV